MLRGPRQSASGTVRAVGYHPRIGRRHQHPGRMRSAENSPAFGYCKSRTTSRLPAPTSVLSQSATASKLARIPAVSMPVNGRAAILRCHFAGRRQSVITRRPRGAAGAGLLYTRLQARGPHPGTKGGFRPFSSTFFAQGATPKPWRGRYLTAPTAFIRGARKPWFFRPGPRRAGTGLMLWRGGTRLAGGSGGGRFDGLSPAAWNEGCGVPHRGRIDAEASRLTTGTVLVKGRDGRNAAPPAGRDGMVAAQANARELMPLCWRGFGAPMSDVAAG